MGLTSPPTSAYLAAPTRKIGAANGIDYVYRDTGNGTPTLVLLGVGPATRLEGAS
jgi:hypothetical protein